MNPALSKPNSNTVHYQPAAIALAGVSFSYPDKPDVLRDVSLKIPSGERVGLIGHNGCGKTTLFMMLSGLFTPTLGEVRLFDTPVRVGQFSSEIGLLFQDPEDQLFSPSVWDDIAFGPRNLGFSEGEVNRRVTAALEMTGIQALAQRPPHHLSGGEKQMVAIAGLLSMNPRILLCDEPTASLDSRTRRRLIQFLQDSDKTLLIASHDLEFLLEVCNRVVLMDSGQIVAEGDPHSIMGNAFLMESHGLECPHSLSHQHRDFER